MAAPISWDTCYVPSTNVVSREIDGEIMIVPITGGIGDLADDLFTLNATGKAIWDACDGQTSLRAIVEGFCTRYDAPRELIERDVAGLVGELCERDMLMPQTV